MRPRVQRYRAGQVPKWAEEGEEEQEAALVSRGGARSEKPGGQRQGISIRLDEGRQEEREEQGVAQVVRRKRPKLEREEQEGEEDDDAALRKMAARRRQMAAAEDDDDAEEDGGEDLEAAAFLFGGKAASSSASSSSSSGSSSSSSSSSSEEEAERVLLRPVFVSKQQRTLVEDEAAVAAKKAREAELAAAERASDVAKSKELVQAKLLADAELEARKEQAHTLEAEDEEDTEEEEAFAKWKERELARLKRDFEERQQDALNRSEVERRRHLTDAQILEEDERSGKKKKEARTKRGFMQKYYHRGAFYQDELAEKYGRRDFDGATGLDAEVDKSTLPSAMQVRDKWGMRGRSKYTHLADQDTTTKEDRAMQRAAYKPSKKRKKSERK